jgi:hypothetical protein
MPIDVSKVRASAVDYLKYYDLEKYCLVMYAKHSTAKA